MKFRHRAPIRRRPHVQQWVPFTVLVLVLMIRPTGLLGEAIAKKILDYQKTGTIRQLEAQGAVVIVLGDYRRFTPSA